MFEIFSKKHFTSGKFSFASFNIFIILKSDSTLKELANEGLINKIDISESKCIFDKNVILHAHKVNDMTGEIEDVFSEELDTLVRSLVDKGIVSYNLVIHYK